MSLDASGVVERWPLVGRGAEVEAFERALADSARLGLLLHGSAGVGKTYLGDEMLARANREGHGRARVAASATAGAVPLGAIAHLLPPSAISMEEADPVALFGLMRESLESEAKRTVVLVDDLPLLDLASVTLLVQLAQAGVVFLLGTVRKDEVIPDSVAALVRSGAVLRIDLPLLDRDTVEALLHLALGGPLEGAAAEALWHITEGNSLALRELVLGSIGAGRLAETGGVWQLRGELNPTQRLLELIGARLDQGGDDGKPVLELLALCGSVGLAEAEEVAPVEVLERLESIGLVVVRTEQRRTLVELVHPLHGEVLRGRTPSLRARAVLNTQADRVEARGAGRPEDALRIATWRLDAGANVDPDLLERAAQVARGSHAYEMTERLARAAWTERPTPSAGVLAGEAGYQQGRFDAADEILRAAALLDAPEVLKVRIAQARSTNLFWGLLRPDDALAVDQAALAETSDLALRAELQAGQGAILTFGGQPGDAVGVLDAVDTTASARVGVLWAIPRAVALSMVGRTAEAIAVADAGWEAHLRLDDALVVSHPGTHMVNKVFALCDAGRLAEAVELGTLGYDIAVRERIPLAHIWFTLNLGRASLLQGLPVTARRWFGEAAAVADGRDFRGPQRMAAVGLASAAGMVGDADGGDAALAGLDEIGGTFEFLSVERGLGEGWLLVAKGDPEGARRAFRDHADRAAATGHLVSESWLRHEAVRLGDAGSQAARLAELAATSDSKLVAARAAHAGGLATGDADALAAAAAELEAVGALLVAAEAEVAAADAERRTGRPRQAAAHTAHATELAARCEGARTPALTLTDAVVPLSAREREVAVLAAAGVQSKEIAERLFLSVRTVNNHLQSCYTKLGVSNRAGLADALRRE